MIPLRLPRGVPAALAGVLLLGGSVRGAEDLPGEAAARVRAQRSDYVTLADRIWDLAEPAMEEFASAALLAARLRDQGFRVEMGSAGMPTAFVATAGSGEPRLGFLAEYDALPGLGQAAAAEPSPRPGAGHGCGHNLLGVGVVAAAEAAAAVLRQHGLPGTVMVFGTPAEETGVGKVFLARDGVFDGLAAAFTWHPSDVTTASYGSTLAVHSLRFRFRGQSAHAAAAPERGRSALDAVEITNVAVNFLREHLPQEVRIHYAITDGGEVPNVVPDHAEVWYYVRAPRRTQVEEVVERVKRCAEAGALAAGVELDVHLESALHEVNPNQALARVLDRHLRAAREAPLDPAARQFGQRLQESLGVDLGAPVMAEAEPPAGGWAFQASTDVGEVSWIAPTTILKVATWPRGCPAHTWQAVAAGRTPLGHGGMMRAAQAMAAAAVELAVRPEALRGVRDEFRRSTQGRPFRSGMPPGSIPPVVSPPEGYPRGALGSR